ncbi:MAG: chlorite dismutase family protein [Dehalococcoidia bacterium]
MTSSPGPGDASAQPTRRQYVKFTFFKVDPSWRRLRPDEREQAKQDLCRAVESYGDRLLIRSYSLIGLRGDADILLWQVGDGLDEIQELTTAVFGSAMGPYLSTSHAYLAMTRRSIYVTPKLEHELGEGDRSVIRPSDAKYFFVYPFVKTRAWYKLTKSARQGMMDEHIAIGRKYPSVKLNTTYSYGLDDQEFMLSFETDEPSDFLDLVMELRETEASGYTLRDTPIFSCIAMPLRQALDSLGAPGDAVAAPVAQDGASAGDGWARVASLAELPYGGSKVVYAGGEQVALFNISGRLYAVANRCPHANGPLADGEVDGTTVTCPWHASRFDLETGAVLAGPAVKPVATYQVEVRDGKVYLSPGGALVTTARSPSPAPPTS